MTASQPQVELLVERAVRAAARAGNQLLAGSTARVDIAAVVPREALLCTLSRMGVRCAEPGGPADFLFVDTPRCSSERAGATPVVVSLSGEAVASRKADAAARMTWAAQRMPATAHLAKLLAHEIAGTRPRIAVSLVLEPKTAAFTLTLADAGCDVALFSAVSETDPEIAHAVQNDGRVVVFAPTGSTPAECAAEVDVEHAAAVLAWAPDYLIDDGAHLIRLAHTEHPAAFERLRGAAEETTSGVRPLREMVARGELKIPVIAVNDARTKTGFDNRIGTGQSCVFAIADVLDGPQYAGISGTRWVVIGYGPVGEGTARFAAALGARVTVVEHDPVRALAALHDGYEAKSMAEALAAADVVVSATGVWHTVEQAHFEVLRPGSVVAVAGGIDDELALDQLRAAGWSCVPVDQEKRGIADEWRAPETGRDADAGVIVLARGGGVNYTAGEGNPIEVMDLSFATQVAAILRLLRERPGPGVHTLSAAEERLVAQAALSARGGEVQAAPVALRSGGAAQPWATHRYRALKPER